MSSGSFLYDRVRDLSLEIGRAELSGRSSDTSYGFIRPTTVVTLCGEDTIGVGEDVTTDPDDHERFQADGIGMDLTGSYTVNSFATRVADLDPVSSDDWNEPGTARRWGIESAGLDLALRQAGRTLGDVLDRSYDPVRFVASLRLENPVSTEPLRAWRAIDSDLGFKLDVVPRWDRAFIKELSTFDGIYVLDFKAQYARDDDRAATDPDLYETIVEAFPNAVLEDPIFTDSPYDELLRGQEERISWDARIDGVDAVEALPFAPSWLNIKPARFGSLASLLDTIEYALERDIQLYGGGMFEQDRGRAHLHALASLFYPDGPNDVAPPRYNETEPSADVPHSPLEPPATPGLGF
jgi:hypothetical protein